LHGLPGDGVKADRAHSTTGRLMTLGCASISARALAASVTPACTAGSSLRQVVPLRLTSVSQPLLRSQASSRSAGTPCFLEVVKLRARCPAP
jgi:hypothetical protein